MKLADFFIKLGVVGDTKKLDKTIQQMETLNKRNKDILKYRKDLSKATTESEKALIKKNFADQIRIENLKKEKGAVNANIAAFKGAAAGIMAFVGAATIAYNVIDRMASAFSQANQKMITFQRTTGLSLSSLNKYASASASVNYNATIEGTAQSMQRVAQNLWDIRMGRGDISPYQELAYVGGRAFNPIGMSVEDVIENIREAIKGVDDLQATNIITRMGFSPDDLLMLRMSREEFEQINSLFLSPEQREAMNLYALNLKKIQLEFNLLKDKALLKIMPLFINLSKFITDTIRVWAEFGNKIINIVNANNDLKKSLEILGVAIVGLLAYLNPLLAAFTAIYLIIEDVVYGFMGYDSLTKRFLDFMDELHAKMADNPIAQYFKDFIEGIESLTHISLPAWLIGLFTGNWGFAINDYVNAIKELISQIKVLRGESVGEPNLQANNAENNALAFNPVYAPPTNNNINNTSSTVNNNTQMDVSIATNQPIGNVLTNLQNTYGFTQASYAGVPV